MNDPWAGFLISSTAWQGVRHSEAISAVRAAGFGGVEILCKPGHFEHDNSAHVSEAQAALAEWPDAIVTFHAPFHTADLGSADSAIWDEDVRHVAQALRVASTFRAESATLHVRSRGEGMNWASENLPAFRRALDVLVPIAAACRMTLSVENTNRFTSEPEDLLRLIETHPADLVGVCIDTGHAHLAGETILIAGMLAPRAFVMHIHDNHAQARDEHLIPGQGTIPWAELVEALQTHGFAGRCVIEVVTSDPLDKTLGSVKEAILQTGISELVGGENG